MSMRNIAILVDHAVHFCGDIINLLMKVRHCLVFIFLRKDKLAMFWLKTFICTIILISTFKDSLAKCHVKAPHGWIQDECEQAEEPDSGYLDITCHNTTIDDYLFEMFELDICRKYLTNLRELRITNSKFPNIYHLLSPTGLSNLNLNLANNNLTSTVANSTDTEERSEVHFHLLNLSQSLTDWDILMYPKYQREDFHGLDSLKMLNLNDNNIRDIALGSFQNIPQLQSLLIANNNLTQIKIGTFSNLASLKEIPSDT
ncbi:hypothetical protein HUJ05_012024 [Dendroctonus ponderosae]|nr:hypothetical protein HUJ05_012024 [Dendroctonus ponderosae]